MSIVARPSQNGLGQVGSQVALLTYSRWASRRLRSAWDGLSATTPSKLADRLTSLGVGLAQIVLTVVPFGSSARGVGAPVLDMHREEQLVGLLSFP